VGEEKGGGDYFTGYGRNLISNWNGLKLALLGIVRFGV
jgi:hypothetical protein